MTTCLVCDSPSALGEIERLRKQVTELHLRRAQAEDESDARGIEIERLRAQIAGHAEALTDAQVHGHGMGQEDAQYENARLRADVISLEAQVELGRDAVQSCVDSENALRKASVGEVARLRAALTAIERTAIAAVSALRVTQQTEQARTLLGGIEAVHVLAVDALAGADYFPKTTEGT